MPITATGARSALLGLLLALSLPAFAGVQVLDLKTDSAREPLGIGNSTPRLGWRMEADRRGVMQSARQVLVASTPDKLAPGKADLWDSRRTTTSEPWVDYAGAPLGERQLAYWTVRVWDERGEPTAWAAAARFETALGARPWQAQWIAGPARGTPGPVNSLMSALALVTENEFCRPVGVPGALALSNQNHLVEYLTNFPGACRAARPAPLLRRSFAVTKPLRAARLYLSGLAYADAQLNGQPLGEGAVLDPGYTDYAKTVLYRSYDVTAALQSGENVLGVELGSGFYDYDVVGEWAWTLADWRGEPRLIAELHLDYADGSRELIPSDERWQTLAGPTRYDNINIGETYDARKAVAGWAKPGFDAGGWAAARPVTAPLGQLTAQTHEPIAVIGEKTAIAVTEPLPGVRIYDLGEQMTGWAEIEIEAAAGTAVSMTYGEAISRTGLVGTTSNLHVGDQLQTDYYIAAGTGRERWRPRFSYKGFRYLQVSGTRNLPFTGTVHGVRFELVRSALREVGGFNSSDALLNGIQDMVRRAIGNNLHGIVTDTPVYEKNGWTGDGQLTAPTAALLFDMSRLHGKWLRDIRDSQTPSGEISDIVPSSGQYGYTGVGWEPVWGATPAWDAALFLIPWETWQRSGDARVLRDNYAAMRLYLDDWIVQWRNADNPLLIDAGLGDHVTPAGSLGTLGVLVENPATLNTLVSTAYYSEFLRIAAEVAAMQGEADVAARYNALRGEVREAFNTTYFDAAAGLYRDPAAGEYLQTANVLPLAFGLVPEGRAADVAASLAADVAVHGGNLFTGIVGTRYILQALCAAGLADVAFGIVSQTDNPSWGEWIGLGYTALSESWGSSIRSLAHHMFGSVGQWFIEDLAGLEGRAPGYAEIEFRPEVPSTGLDSAEAFHDSVRGRIASRWQRDAAGFTLEVTVPPNATGLVHFPGNDPAAITENGQRADTADSVTLLRVAEGRVVYRVGSGQYRFHSLPADTPAPVGNTNSGRFGGGLGALLLLVLLTAALARSRRWLPVLLLAAPAWAAPVEIITLSNRADLISGGDALVELRLPVDRRVEELSIDLDGRPLSGVFARRADGRITGRVEGLALGPNQLRVRLPDGQGAALTLTNHPHGGPVFAGAQVQPWPCLAGAEDAQCNRAPRYEYFYMPAAIAPVSASGANHSAADGFEGAMGIPPHLFQRYDPAMPPPAMAIRTITTDHGVTLPYIVRMELGSQDRGQYRIAVLHDPAGPEWQPWAPQAGWNGKTYITGGSGCGSHYGESVAPGVLDDNALARGYLVMATSMNHNTRNCNLVVQAEALMMLKETVSERYGPIRLTIGSGGSGGAIYQQQVANAYPGIFDGILPLASYPDIWSTLLEVQDCALLLNYWDTARTRGVTWTPTEQVAVTGHPHLYVCMAWVQVQGFDTMLSARRDARLTDAQSCNITAEAAYDPVSNPTGVRCALQDYMVSIFGRRPDGFANRPWDNEGVQYGLRALLDGQISAAQFVDLNEQIGGLNIDRDFAPARSRADLPALEVAYRAGLINQGHHLSAVPIIDLRGHDRVEIHADYRSVQMRARLDRSQGHHDNQVIWTGPIALLGDLDFPLRSLTTIDAWLTAARADPRPLPAAQKLIANRPTEAIDQCWSGLGPTLPEGPVCDSLRVYASEPRGVAGMDVAGDVLKCQRQPLRPEDYPGITFTDAQWLRLQALFAEGVCDYQQPGVAQQPALPWLTFSAGPGGKALPDAPRSQPLTEADATSSLRGGSLNLALLLLMTVAAFARRSLRVLLALLLLPAAALAQDGQPRQCEESLVAMSDGVRLHTWVSLPTTPGPHPVLFEFESYASHGNGCPAYLPSDYFPHFLSPEVMARFALVHVSYRGTGASEGLFDLGDTRTQQDVREALAWASSQPWSNGRTLLTGQSGSGFAAHYGLGEASVKGALIYTSCADQYRCMHRGGIANGLSEVYMAKTLAGYQGALQDRQRLGTDAGEAERLAAFAQAQVDLRAHPLYDDFWQRRSGLPYLKAAKVPVLYMSEPYDIVQSFDALQETPGARFIFGMGHSTNDLITNSNGRHVALVRSQADRFAAHYGLGEANGAERDPRVVVQTVIGGVRPYRGAQALVRYEAQWPLPGTVWTRLYFDAGKSGTAQSSNDGLLSAQLPATEAEDLLPVADAPGRRGDLRTTSWLVGATVAEFSADEAAALSYTTPVLTRDTELSGPIALRLVASSSASDLDWQVLLTDVTPEGRSEWISDGYLRASLRAMDLERSLHNARGDLLRPWYSYDSAEPVQRDTVVEYEIEVIPTSALLRAGHRLRLDVFASNASGIDAPPLLSAGLVRVLRGGPHPSSVLLPLIPGRCQAAVPLRDDIAEYGPCAKSWEEAIGIDAGGGASDPENPMAHPRSQGVFGGGFGIADASAMLLLLFLQRFQRTLVICRRGRKPRHGTAGDGV